MHTVSSKIIEALNKTPKLDAGELVKATGLTSKQVYHALAYLKKKKILRRVNRKYSVVFGMLPDVVDIPPIISMLGPVKEEKVVVDKYVRGPSERDFRELKGKFDRLEYEHEELKNKCVQATIAHLDAKAVIAYLEARLVSHK